MNRILSSLKRDFRILYLTGFFTASWIATLVWILVLGRLPQTLLASHFVLLLACPLFVQTFLGVLHQIRREQVEGTFTLLRATPLRPHEYLAAKAGSWMILGLGQSILAYTLIQGFHLGLVYLALGTVTLISLATLVGFIVAVQFPAPHFRILPVGLILFLAALTWLPNLGFSLGHWKYAHPVQASLTLMELSVNLGSIGDGLYGLGYGFFCVALALVFCKGALAR